MNSTPSARVTARALRVSYALVFVLALLFGTQGGYWAFIAVSLSIFGTLLAQITGEVAKREWVTP